MIYDVPLGTSFYIMHGTRNRGAPGSLVHLKTWCRLCTKKVPCFRCASDRFLGAQVTAGARVVLRGRRNTL